MKKILMIAHFCSDFNGKGNNRFNYLATLLSNAGNDVDFVTTSFSHNKKSKRKTCNNTSYTVKFIDEPGYKKNVSIKRFYSHYIFGKNLKQYLKSIDKPDLVYASVPSLDAAAAAAEYCKKNQIPFIVDIQDLWPEAFELVFNIPVLKNILFAPLTWNANKIYKAADKIIAVSETYLKRGLAVNKKDGCGLCVFLGTDLTDFDEVAADIIPRTDNEFRIGYAGTLGHSYNITIIIDAVKILQDKGYKNIVFNVFGDGPLMEEFINYAEKEKVNCNFRGRLDYKTMVAELCGCDIAVNPISKGAAQSIINKHGDYAAAGLPVVSTQECDEYRNLLEEYKCGINCECEDTKAVADAIERLYLDSELRKTMGANSRKMAEEKFDRRNTNKKIIELIDDLLKS